MPLVIYTLLRFALLGAAFGVLYWVGLRGWLLPIVAVVVALSTSYLVLRKPRDAATAWMASQSERRAARAAVPRVDADASHEDAQIDATLRSTPGVIDTQRDR